MKYILKAKQGTKVPFKPTTKTNKTAPINSSQIDTNIKTVYKLYKAAKDRGLSDTQAASLLGNIAVETMGTFSPTQKQLGGGPGRGLIQMEVGTPRYKHFTSSVKNPNDLDEQYNYILNTFYDQSTPNLLNVWGGYGRQDRWVKNPNLPLKDSTRLLTELYFRPGVPNTQERQRAAEYIYSKINDLKKLELTNWLPKQYVAKSKKGGWIQKAVNPAHRGYCTPMTKSTCTPHRKALAKRFKSGEFRKHQEGGKLEEIISNYKSGGGLSREKNYGSDKKPYPSVAAKDFAGNGRSYPIPTKADAIDALRLAGLHGRKDVKAKVYKKYPELKKHKQGGKINLENILSQWKK